MRLEKSATVLFFCHTERCGTHCVPNFQHLTFAECALYFASRNNNNWTTEWTTNKRHISAGKSVGIKRLQKKARRSSHPDHFFCPNGRLKRLCFMARLVRRSLGEGGSAASCSVSCASYFASSRKVLHKIRLSRLVTA